MSWAQVTIAPISSIPSEEKPIARSSERPARSTSTSGAVARCFITLISVCPPASARAPSLRRENRDRLVDRGRTSVFDLAEEHLGIQSRARVTCQAASV